MKLKTALTALIATVALSLPLRAAFEEFTITLAPEGGGGRTGSGFGTLTLDDVANTLTFNDITWGGLSADSTLAHIHGPAGVFPATAGVMYDLSPTYITVGAGIRSGTISGTLSLVDGTAGFTINDQITQLESGLWYINIHSSAAQGGFPGGEIRGQIVVPEPSTWALVGAGLGLLAVRGGRLRRVFRRA